MKEVAGSVKPMALGELMLAPGSTRYKEQLERLLQTSRPRGSGSAQDRSDCNGGRMYAYVYEIIDAYMYIHT